MRVLLFLFLSAAPLLLHGLRLGVEGDPGYIPFWSEEDEDASGDTDTPAVFRNEAMVKQQEEGAQELLLDADPGECAFDGTDGGTTAEFLAGEYLECADNTTYGFEHSQQRDCQLKQSFSRPEFAYSPYLTGLPVFYISRGRARESCFNAFLGKFSPVMQRVEAVILGDNITKQLAATVKDPGVIVHNLEDFGAHFSVREWKKRWGCLLAHLEAILLAYRKGLNVAIILEDDAVPLYPVWTSPLEEFLLTLPPEWQAVQLQWTSKNGTVFDKASRGRAYAQGTGWGTAAYIIHRRGMETLLERLYDRASGKFDLKYLASSCRKISADDCLLGFSASTRLRHLGGWWYPSATTSRSSKRGPAKRVVKYTRPLRHTVKATPPMFLHDSRNTMLHEKNYCMDLELAGNATCRSSLSKAKAKYGVLLFFAVGASQSSKASSILKENVLRFVAAGYDVFLAFAGTSNAPAVSSARKLQLLRQHWKAFGPSWSKRYTYVWAVDEDVNLTHVDPHKMVTQAQQNGALVVAPALRDLSVRRSLEARRFTDREPNKRCRFRFTNYVGALAPMMPPVAWERLFKAFPRSSSLVGADAMWCNFLQATELWNGSAKAAGLANRSIAANASALTAGLANGSATVNATSPSVCAIMDNLRAVHDDDEEGSLKGEIRKAEKTAASRVMKRHKSLLVNVGLGRGGRLQSSCVA